MQMITQCHVQKVMMLIVVVYTVKCMTTEKNQLLETDGILLFEKCPWAPLLSSIEHLDQPDNYS